MSGMKNKSQTNISRGWNGEYLSLDVEGQLTTNWEQKEGEKSFLVHNIIQFICILLNIKLQKSPWITLQVFCFGSDVFILAIGP